MRQIGILVIWFGMTSSLTAEGTIPPPGLGLAEAVERALNQNPLVQATTSGEAAAAARLKEAKSGRLPFLAFGQSYTHSNNPVFVFGSLLEQGRFSSIHFDPGYLNSPGAVSNFRSSLDIHIPLFNRFQVSSNIGKAEIQEEQAEADTDWTRQQLRFQVVRAYYGVLVAEARRQVASEAVRTAESETERIKDRYEQGMVVESDLLAMEVQLAEFRQQLVQAEGEEKTARAALNTVLAQPVGSHETLTGKLENRTFSVPPQTELIEAALENRPDYLRSEMEVRLRREDLKISKGQYWPDFNVFGQLGYSTQSFRTGGGDFAVGAKLTFNLLDFGREARTGQSSAASDAARAQERQKANEIQFEVVQAYQNFVTSKERVDVAAKAVDQASETLRIVKDRHGVGLTTITEVLRSQTALLRMQLNVLAARYDYYVSYAQTLLAIGLLTDVTNIAQ